MIRSDAKPNLFTGDIDDREVAARMSAITDRSSFVPGKAKLDDYQTETVPMSRFHDQPYNTDREEIETLIRGVMSGWRLRTCFENATQLITVRHRSTPSALLGTALCSVGPYHDFDTIVRGKSETSYAWYLSAYGTQLDSTGRMNEYVLRRIAQKAHESILNVLDTLHSLYGTYSSDSFPGAIYLDAAHYSEPTKMSDGIHHRIDQLIGVLDKVVDHPARMGTGFSDAIVKVDEYIGYLKTEHADNPLVQSLSESRPIKQGLSSQSISMGGDESTYQNMQRTASATLQFLESVQRGLDTGFLRFTAKDLAQKPVLESSEDSAGNISVLADQQSGYPEASVHLSPEGELGPEIRFGENYNAQSYVPALLGELWKKVIVGKWWQSEVAATS